MPKKLQKKTRPTIHSDLKDFDIKINAFGQMETNYSIDMLNKFLNEKTNDKKTDDSSDDSNKSEIED